MVRPAEEGRGTGQRDRAAGNPAKRLMSELLKSAVEGLKSQHRREGRQSPKRLRTGLRGLCERGGGVTAGCKQTGEQEARTESRTEGRERLRTPVLPGPPAERAAPGPVPDG